MKFFTSQCQIAYQMSLNGEKKSDNDSKKFAQHNVWATLDVSQESVVDI